MHGEKFLRFHLTIAAQVKGHLYGRRNDNTPMYANQQTTRRIVDSIMLEARQRRGEEDQLVNMLREV